MLMCYLYVLFFTFFLVSKNKTYSRNICSEFKSTRVLNNLKHNKKKKQYRVCRCIRYARVEAVFLIIHHDRHNKIQWNIMYVIWFFLLTCIMYIQCFSQTGMTLRLLKLLLSRNWANQIWLVNIAEWVYMYVTMLSR